MKKERNYLPKYSREWLRFLSYAKLCLILLLFSTFSLQANSYAQATKLSLKLENVTINDVLKQVRKETNLRFLYRVEEVNNYGTRNINVKDADIDELLKVLLKETNLSYVIDNGVVIITPSPVKSSTIEKKIIWGKVVDKNGQPLPGVSVTIKETTLGMATDNEGLFKIELPAMDNIILRFSFIGMETKDIPYHNEPELKVVMTEAKEDLDEVVVTGYQTIKKERMTGSISTVTAQTIAESGVTSIDQVLRGKLAGVSVMNTSGRPGTNAQVRIRGLNSISGNMDPIWIIDGMEIQGAVPTVNVGGTNLQNTIFTNGIGNVSPEDIKSISVLKDAAASALYGARAANGVIVIETKRGTAGEDYISTTINYSLSEAPSNKLDMMNTQEKIAYERGIYEDFSGYKIEGRVFRILQDRDKGIYTAAEAEQLINELSQVNTNWFDVIFQVAKSQRYGLTFSGGTPKLQYYASANLNKEEGILKGNNLLQANTSLMLNYKPNEKIKIDASIRTNINKDEMPNSIEDPFEYATYANTYEKPYEKDGSYAYDRSYYGTPNTLGDDYRYDYNILEDMASGTRKSRSTSTTIMGKLTYDIWKGLSLESQVDYTYASNHGEEFSKPGTIASYQRNILRNSGMYDDLPESFNNGYLKETTGYSEVWAVRNMLKYNQEINKKHFINVMIGQEISDKHVRNFFNMMPEYNPDYEVGGYPAQIPSGVSLSSYRFSMLGNSGRSREKASSFFATGSYSYEDRYIAGASIRYDGVDIIGNENQFSPLWNISAKWNLHNEPYIPKKNWLNVLSLRFSYGYTGSIDKNALPFSYLTFKSINYYDGTTIPTNINWKNPSIKWQKKLDRNIGMDFALLNSRLNGEINYYNNVVEDLLDAKKLPVSSGSSSIRANVASTVNRGVEISLNGVIIDKSNWRWTLDFNYSLNKSEVKKTYFNNLYDLPIVERNNAAYMAKYYTKGFDVSAWFGYEFAGVDPQTGNTLSYVNDESKVHPWEIHSERDGRKIIDMDRNFNHEAAITYLGNQYPTTSGGFGTMLKYKQLSLTTQFSYMCGNKIKSHRYSTFTDMYAAKMNRLTCDLNRWRQPGDITDVPKFQDNTYYAYNKYFFDNELESGNFLKMTYLTVAWFLPKDFLEKLGLTRCKLSFNAQNLFTLTKYKGIDPENNGAFGYPSARKYTFGLDINI